MKIIEFFKDVFEIFTTPAYLLDMLQGFGNTIVLTVVAAIIGLFLGFTVAIIKISAEHYSFMKLPAFFCTVYTTVIRGTPVALQLFIMILAILSIPGFKPYAAILTFGINSGAYVSESIRAGISSIDHGQMEAGRALGLDWKTTMLRIIMPQAIKNIIPAIGNEMIALLKETAIISIVGATPGTLTYDLSASTNTIFTAQATYLPAGVVAGGFYLAIVYLLTYIIKIIEKRLKASDKR